MDPASLMSACVVSSIGLSLFVYGKKQVRPPQLLAGMALMALPLFTGDVAWMLGAGTAVVAAMRAAIVRGA